jgi:hypothetical protein
LESREQARTNSTCWLRWENLSERKAEVLPEAKWRASSAQKWESGIREADWSGLVSPE